MLWNVAKRSMLRSVPYPASDSTIIPPTALSPDGTLLAVGSCGKVQNGSCAQGQVQLWDVGSGTVNGQALSQPQPAISGVAFSPDGTILAESTHKGIVLWNMTTRKRYGNTEMLVLPTDNTCPDCYNHLLFSPDGKVLASYSIQGFNFVLWDIGLQEALAGPIAQEGFNQGSIAFSPDGQQLVSVSASTVLPDKRVVTLWDITIDLWREHACSIANRNLTLVEWQHFVPGKDYSKVCPNLAT
jgi:WD40 repeat protein